MSIQSNGFAIFFFFLNFPMFLLFTILFSCKFLTFCRFKSLLLQNFPNAQSCSRFYLRTCCYSEVMLLSQTHLYHNPSWFDGFISWYYHFSLVMIDITLPRKRSSMSNCILLSTWDRNVIVSAFFAF